MDYRILGLLEVVGDQRVEVPGAKLRALLAMLLLHANEVVRAERLAEALWGEDPPPSWPSSLRLHVSHLRRALGASAVNTRPTGYVLIADPADIDARRFQRLAADGRRALQGGDPEGAAALLGDALALWRGPALAEFCDAPFAQAEAAGLEEQRLVAQEDLADAELACGRHGDTVGKLQTLVGEYPLRERLWSSLMLALYRCGRQAEALRAFQSLRRVLADELGIEPSPALQRLEEAILLQKPGLDTGPIAIAPPAQSGPATIPPLPARLGTDGGRGAFVGRDEPLATLVDSLKEADALRSRRFVLISGEPGIGKTTLVAEFARRAHAGGATVLYGRCDEGLPIAYQPWEAAVAHLIEHGCTGGVADVVRDHGADLAHLGPDVAVRVRGGGGGSGDPDTARHLLFGAVRQLLEAAICGAPVVLVLDDLQWADEPSLTLLRHVLGSDRPASLLVVGTFRDADVGANAALADLLATLRRDRRGCRVGLGGLSVDDLRELVEADMGRTAEATADALCETLARETGGNPFFVRELLRHAVEARVVTGGDDGWEVAGDLAAYPLPAGVREVIARRVARLGDDAQRILPIAAVLGRDFDLGGLSAASGTADDVVLDVLDAAVAATLVVNVSGDQFSFVHALVQHALYDSLNPARRARAHRRAADAIEAVGIGGANRSAELAHHHLQAGVLGDRARALVHARAAADHALAQLAPSEALRWYRTALDLIDPQGGDERIRARLLVGLGDAQRQTGVAGFRATLQEAALLAHRIGDTDALAAALLADHGGPVTRAGLVDVERVPLIDAALDAIGPSDSPLRARLLALLALEQAFDGDYPTRRRLSDESVSMARRLGDKALIIEVLRRRFIAIFNPDTLAERLADTAEAVRLAADVDDPIDRFWAANYRATSALEGGDVTEFARYQREATAQAAAIGQPTLRWLTSKAPIAHALMAGDIESAELLSADSLCLGRDGGEHDAQIVHDSEYALIRWHQGRVAEVVDRFAEHVAANPHLPVLTAGLALFSIDSGRDGAARDLLVAEAAAGFPHPFNYLLLADLACWAEVAAHLGDQHAAAALYDRLSRWPDQVVFIVHAVMGSTAHYLGLLATTLGRYDEADAHFAAAAVTHERLGAPFHLARTRLAWGQMLLARNPSGPPDEARTHLAAALDLADRYGCALVAKRARELLG